MLHVALARRRQHGAGAKEQQALEYAVIENVEQRGCQRKRCGSRHIVRRKSERKTEADEDDPNVLDRVVGEQSLEVVLHQGAEHAEHARRSSERDHDDAPPPGRRPVEVEDDADEAVDRDLGHYPAHQRRDVAWCSGVSEGKPDMQRHKPCLRTGAQENQDQDQSGLHAGRAAHLVERIATGRTCE